MIETQTPKPPACYPTTEPIIATGVILILNYLTEMMNREVFVLV